jgi:hypothetical protein
VFSKLKSDFVVGWRNIITEKYVGESFGYTCDQTAVGTTNGAGPHNVQIFVLAPDLTVLHALPGFWHPEDLAQELEFSKTLHRLWNDNGRSRQEKDVMFAQLQLAEPKNHSKTTTIRSSWQGFDAKNEQKRRDAGHTRDTFLTSVDGSVAERRGRPKMKPINQLVHERMAQRPFVKFKDFDVAVFADYGRILYDNNRRVDGRGAVFMTPRKVEKQKQRQDRRRVGRERKMKQVLERRARAAKQRSKQRSKRSRRKQPRQKGQKRRIV